MFSLQPYTAVAYVSNCTITLIFASSGSNHWWHKGRSTSDCVETLFRVQGEPFRRVLLYSTLLDGCWVQVRIQLFRNFQLCLFCEFSVAAALCVEALSMFENSTCRHAITILINSRIQDFHTAMGCLAHIKSSVDFWKWVACPWSAHGIHSFNSPNNRWSTSVTRSTQRYLRGFYSQKH